MHNLKVFMNCYNDANELTKNVVDTFIWEDISEEDLDNAISHMRDTVTHGCASGIASAFIYTVDNIAFMKDNLVDILDLLSDVKYARFAMLEENEYNVDHMVWFAVEFCLSDLFMAYGEALDFYRTTSQENSEE